MKTPLVSKLIMAGLLLLLLFVSAVPVRAQVLNTPLAAGENSIFPLLGLISSWFRRNRTYRSTEEFISDQNNHFDALLNTLDQQLSDGTIYTPKGSGPQTQIAAYSGRGGADRRGTRPDARLC